MCKKDKGVDDEEEPDIPLLPPKSAAGRMTEIEMEHVTDPDRCSENDGEVGIDANANSSASPS